MKFVPTAPDENYPFLKFVTEDGRWEAGLCPVMYGVRVRAGPANSGTCAVDYCAGPDRLFQYQLLDTIIQILETFSSSVTEREIQDILPSYERKPINQDPCWPKLQALRDKLQNTEK